MQSQAQITIISEINERPKMTSDDSRQNSLSKPHFGCPKGTIGFPDSLVDLQLMVFNGFKRKTLNEFD